jgi:hypothetical protein
LELALLPLPLTLEQVMLLPLQDEAALLLLDQAMVLLVYLL